MSLSNVIEYLCPPWKLPGSTIQYTKDVAVITPELLAGHRSQGIDPAIMDRFRIGASPSVFDLGEDNRLYARREPNETVSIWRRELPQLVASFAQNATRIFRRQSVPHDKAVSLDSAGRLVAKRGQPITVDLVADRLFHKGVAPAEAEAFAGHYTSTLTGVLANVPAGTQLEHIATGRPYSIARRTYLDGHQDNSCTLLMPFTEPGTPYFIGPRKNKLLARSKAGDVTVHGRDAWHAHATAPSPAFMQNQRRFMTIFRIVPPR